MNEPTRTYRATFNVNVEITVPEEAVTRVLENTDGWREHYYNLDERGVVEMLARCCGIHGTDLYHLDGWGDMPPHQVSVTLDYDMEAFERVMK
jgi:hypothetical protein